MTLTPLGFINLPEQLTLGNQFTNNITSLLQRISKECESIADAEIHTWDEIPSKGASVPVEFGTWQDSTWRRSGSSAWKPYRPSPFGIFVEASLLRHD